MKPSNLFSASVSLLLIGSLTACSGPSKVDQPITSGGSATSAPKLSAPAATKTGSVLDLWMGNNGGSCVLEQLRSRLNLHFIELRLGLLLGGYGLSRAEGESDFYSAIGILVQL